MGKTSACLMFAETAFPNFIHMNLENVEHRRLFREDVSLGDFQKIVEVVFKQKVVPGTTLIFLDEIQSAPSLVKLLRFFYEEMPGLHVIAAGSLLEVMPEKEGFSFPVGRVESLYMHPMDFFEFLQAKGEDRLLDVLKQVSLADPMLEGIHAEALRQFQEYTMLGGMPEAVKVYLEQHSIQATRSVYASLMTGYSEDVYKYASSASARYQNFVIEQAPLFAGAAITYEKFGASSYKSREMSDAFSVLEKAMLLYQIQATKSGENGRY